MDWFEYLVVGLLLVSSISLTVQAVQARRDQARAARAGEHVGSLWHHMMQLHRQREVKRKTQQPRKPSAPFKPSLVRTPSPSKVSRAIRTGWSIGEVEFAYEDAEGEVTFRRVTVHSVTATNLKGECHDRGEERTFRLDRIIGDLTDCETGEILKPKSWAKQVGYRSKG